MVNKPLIRPYFWRGVRYGGGRLTSHELRYGMGGIIPGLGFPWSNNHGESKSPQDLGLFLFQITKMAQKWLVSG